MPTALKVIDTADWAGDRGEAVVSLMVELRDELAAAFGEWAGDVAERVQAQDALPAPDVITAAVSLVRFRLGFLELENLLRTTYYGEAELPRYQVVDDYLGWFAGHLDLDEESYADLVQRVLPLALADDAEKKSKLESLWDLAVDTGSKLKNALSGVLTRFLDAGAQQGGQSVYDALGVGVTFKLEDKRAIEFLQEYALSFSALTAAGSEERIRKVLLESLAKGRTAAETGKEIQKVRTSLERHQAERIARTELIRAHSEGQLAALRETGAAYWQWMTAEDERTCPACAPLDGVVFPIDGDDPRPPLHPHCRCTLTLPEAEFDALREALLG